MYSCGSRSLSHTVMISHPGRGIPFRNNSVASMLTHLVSWHEGARPEVTSWEECFLWCSASGGCGRGGETRFGMCAARSWPVEIPSKAYNLINCCPTFDNSKNLRDVN